MDDTKNNMPLLWSSKGGIVMSILEEKMDLLEEKIKYAKKQLKAAEAKVEWWKRMLKEYDKIIEVLNEE